MEWSFEEMRTSLSIDDETMNLVIETADLQNRTIAGQLRHLVKTHPELVAWKTYRPKPKENQQ